MFILYFEREFVDFIKCFINCITNVLITLKFSHFVMVLTDLEVEKL